MLRIKQDLMHARQVSHHHHSPHPIHIRDIQFPAPTADHGARDVLQSGVGVESHYCSDFLPRFPAPFPRRPGASLGPLPRGCLPASLMNFSLLSRVQSFLQVLTATLIFSPFCNRSVCSGTPMLFRRKCPLPPSARPPQT